MISLGKVGLKLNAAKTKVGTIQAQSPKRLTTRAGLEIEVLDRHRPINGLAVCCPRHMQADGRAILTTDYQVRPVHFMFTNGFSVTKWFHWHLVPKKNPETVQIHANDLKPFASIFFKCFQSVIWANRRLTWSVFQSYISSRRRLRNPSSATVCVRSFSNATSQPQ